MDLVSFLQGLQPSVLNDCYSAPFTAAALFRALPPLGKQYVLRLLLVDDEIAGAVVSSWANPSASGKHIATLDQLKRLALLSTRAGRLGEASYSLDPIFRGQLRHSMCTRLSPAAAKVPQEVLDAAPSAEEADDHARRQWETMLLFLGGSSNSVPAPEVVLDSGSLDVVQLLVSAGLMLKDEQTHLPVITDAGFQFLLADTYGQLWTLLRQYIADAQRESGSTLGSVISFLLQLGFQGSQPLRHGGLGPLEQRVAAHMSQLGLLKPFLAAGGVWLLPTRLATIMAGGYSGAARAADDGFVIVESNYRVYAYTTSPVQISILRLFVRCDVLLPNLFVGTITRDSTMDALKSGIAAEQIVGYLQQHAHPRVAGKVPIVPAVVADQIQLWQAELNRLKVDRATSYFDFETDQLFRQAVAAATRMGVVLSANERKRQLVVASQAHDAMRAELKKIKEQLGV